MTKPEPRWATAVRVRDYLGVHIRTVYRMAAAGTITPHKIEGKTRFDLNELDAKLREGNLADLVAESGRSPERTAADVIARIRTQLPPPGTRPQLIHLDHVHAAINKVAVELGVDGPAS